MNIDFNDKVVLVTGASGGIGRAISVLFAGSGARVAVHYNSNEKEAFETLSELKGENHFMVRANLTDPDSIREMVGKIIEKTGRIHVLVNNAGVYVPHSLMNTTFDEWRERWAQTMSTNLTGPSDLTYLVGRHMAEKGGGKIVNVSSRGAFRGEPDAPAYAASKAGLNAMGQSLAKALAPEKVYIYTVAPGWVDTSMAAAGLSGPEAPSIRNQSPLGRIATPEEVGRAVFLLASEGTEFMTGCILDINGASYLRT